MPEPAGDAALSPDENTRVPGTQIGRFELVEQIGEGSMGAVFTARHMASGRTVVMKLLPRELTEDEAFVARFLEKNQGVVELHHPNIVQCIDVGRDNGECYFAMEFVEGKTLREVLDEEGRIEEEQALRMVMGLASALAHANEYGHVHGRIKPENIMITADGSAKLADLGLARAARTVGETDADGELTPSPEYLAPEQARGHSYIDVRADICALGAVLFHMVTGDPPYGGSTPESTLDRVVTGHVRDPKERNPVLANATCELIGQMMAKRRRDRPQDPAMVVKAIQAILESRAFRFSRTSAMGDDVVVGSLQVPAFVPPRSRSRMALIFGWGAVAVVMLVIIARGCG
jgi:serine/threonine protein kinase